ncbi:PspC domain-containing protein [Propioniciclava coleopterorum]|uniref:PspC domain-containing protein n=1 Tax=Propioniciclava coleopterorum TaxID=2714937 RepID=A0A6G7Y8R2_9ACTN|nr:PspC domain-containing protein [Propioniciclava coleopterorum]
MVQGEMAVPETVDAPARRLVRPLERAQIGGVAAGLSEHTGLSVWVIRGVFVLLGAWQLVGVAAYLALWLVIPPATAQHAAPGVDAASRRGMREQAEHRPLTMPATWGSSPRSGWCGSGCCGWSSCWAGGCPPAPWASRCWWPRPWRWSGGRPTGPAAPRGRRRRACAAGRARWPRTGRPCSPT